MNPTQAIHGTPITPKHLLKQMHGASFCVSYFAPAQLEDVIPLLDAESVLLLDNGAFSAWRRGIELTESYWDAYWHWARNVLDRVPQAIAVIPDVIGGTVAENVRLIQELPDFMWGYEDRLQVVWHLNEPLDHLRWMLESGFGNIAFGSAGEYSTVGTAAWDARIDEAFALIDELTLNLDHGIARPRIHMMRGLGQMKRGRHPFTTADSTNIARNHNRTKGQENHISTFRARIESDSFPAAPCALWPQASWEAPRDMTMAEITAELAECKAALAATMAEALTPHPEPEPTAPAPARPVQLSLSLPMPFYVAMSKSAVYHIERMNDGSRDRGNTGGEASPAQAGRPGVQGMAGKPRMDTGASGRAPGGIVDNAPLLGIWPGGDTRPGSRASPLYRPLRSD